MPSTRYQDFFRAKAPPFLQGPVGDAFLGTIGRIFDAFVDGTDAAVEARFPEGGDSPPSPGAQNAIGRERALPRIEMFAHELDGPYGARLRRAWEDRAFNGSPEGLTRILGKIAATMPAPWTTTIYDHGGWNPWYSWARAWILIDGSTFGPLGNFGDPNMVIGNGSTFGSTATSQQVKNFRAVVRSWCPPWARTDAVLVLDGAVIGAGELFGDPGLKFGGHAIAWPRLET